LSRDGGASGLRIELAIVSWQFHRNGAAIFAIRTAIRKNWVAEAEAIIVDGFIDRGRSGTFRGLGSGDARTRRERSTVHSGICKLPVTFHLRRRSAGGRTRSGRTLGLDQQLENLASKLAFVGVIRLRTNDRVPFGLGADLVGWEGLASVESRPNGDLIAVGTGASSNGMREMEDRNERNELHDSLLLQRWF
jgi:hypothetical protein